MNATLAIRNLIPGLAASVAIALAAQAGDWVQGALFGRVWVDAVVLAILLGTMLRTALPLPAILGPGIGFGAKTVLEWAVVLLGASLTVQAVGQAGAWLLLAVAGVVVLALGASYGIGRLLGLPPRLAALVACGNSICGNSAIAAAAPVLGASSEEVASSIAFTAALGMVVVLVLPLLAMAAGMGQGAYGVLVGLTVYAVPQVLAAALPMGMVSLHLGTLTKLIRVLMLGPVMLALGIAAGRRDKAAGTSLVPWFILGFLALMGLNSLGAIPAALGAVLHQASVLLTIVSMAALGLSVDIRTVAVSGGRVLAAGALSILMLAGLALVAIRFLPPLG